MKKVILLMLCVFCSMICLGQAELVKEFVPGNEGTSTSGDSYNQDVSVKLADDLIILALRGEFGRELYKIDGDGVSLLADLKIGEESSNPQHLTVFEGKVYFVADSDQGARIYSTDGTTEGTQVAFDLGDESTFQYNFTAFLIARDGKLYFEYDGGIYSFSNGTLTQVNDETNPIGIGSVSNANDYGWALYKSGIVLFDLIDGELVLLSIIDGQIDQLATVPYDGTFDDRFAMESYGGNIFFVIDSFDDSVKGEYLFREANGQIVKISSEATYHRTEYLGDNACIVSGYKGATYLFNANNLFGKEINDNRAFTFAGSTWEREQVAGGVLYMGAGGSFDDVEIYFIEENTSTATNVHTTDNMSLMKVDGSYTFYFGESELGDQFNDEDLFAFNHETRSVEPILTLFDTPFNTDITPLGVVNEELYFLGVMDLEIGKELYKVDIGFVTDVEDVNESIDLRLATLGNGQFQIHSEFLDESVLEVRTVSGQLVEKLNVSFNQTFEIETQGMLLITVYFDGDSKTFKVVNQ